MPTTEDIIHEVESEDSTSEDSDSEDNEPSVRPIISLATALTYLQDVKLCLLSQDNGDSLFSSIFSLENFLERAKIRALKQPQITDFFQLKDY